MKYEGQTNLFPAIQTGIEIVSSFSTNISANCTRRLLCLTDGEVFQLK